jgi:hypothetical protein
MASFPIDFAAVYPMFIFIQAHELLLPRSFVVFKYIGMSHPLYSWSMHDGTMNGQGCTSTPVMLVPECRVIHPSILHWHFSCIGQLWRIIGVLFQQQKNQKIQTGSNYMQL